MLQELWQQRTPGLENSDWWDKVHGMELEALGRRPDHAGSFWP